MTLLVASVLLGAFSASSPALAQDRAPSDRIDLTIPVETERQARLRRECEAQREAQAITGEIVVCGKVGDDAESAGWNREEWENRYARKTRGADPVDVAGPGIFRGKPTVGNLCIPGLQKCPPPPAYMVDFAALPEAPPGSDADRIARGLPPTGNAGPAPPSAAGQSVGSDRQAEALGLPPVPDFSGDEEVSPAGSEAPAAPR